MLSRQPWQAPWNPNHGRSLIGTQPPNVLDPIPHSCHSAGQIGNGSFDGAAGSAEHEPAFADGQTGGGFESERVRRPLEFVVGDLSSAVASVTESVL